MVSKRQFHDALPEDQSEMLQSVRKDYEGRLVLGFGGYSPPEPEDVPFDVVDSWEAPVLAKTGLYESVETGEIYRELTISDN